MLTDSSSPTRGHVRTNQQHARNLSDEYLDKMRSNKRMRLTIARPPQVTSRPNMARLQVVLRSSTNKHNRTLMTLK